MPAKLQGHEKASAIQAGRLWTVYQRSSTPTMLRAVDLAGRLTGVLEQLANPNPQSVLEAMRKLGGDIVLVECQHMADVATNCVLEES